MVREIPICFRAGNDQLIGLLHLPSEDSIRGFVVVVGGPQYRVGSHRQFTLFARTAAAAGVPVMRFDYRGMGDSEGESRDFEQIQDDIQGAIDAFMQHAPSVREVVLWGLCDAATASLFYATTDKRICGLVLLNPWARTTQGKAQAYMRHYYIRRLFDADLWRKIRRGRFSFRASVFSFISNLKVSISGQSDERNQGASSTSIPAAQSAVRESLPVRIDRAFGAYGGNTLVILSGDDLTASEFRSAVTGLPNWRQALRRKRLVCRDLAGANHTFASREWRDTVAEWSLAWLRTW